MKASNASFQMCRAEAFERFRGISHLGMLGDMGLLGESKEFMLQ